MIRPFCLALNLWIGFIPNNRVLASPTPQQFFPQNFANEGLESRPATSSPSNAQVLEQMPQAHATLNAPDKETISILSSLDQGMLTGDPNIDVIIKRSLSDTVARAQRFVPPSDSPQSAAPAPTFIVVYVNSLDREHFNRLVQSVVRFNGSNNAQVLGVFQMGDWRNVTQQQEDALNAAGSFLQPIAFLPDHLKGLTSPIWEVRSGNTTAYLSGIFNVSRFFSANGEIKLEPNSDKTIGSDVKLDGF